MLGREFGVGPNTETERIRKRILESVPEMHYADQRNHQSIPASLRGKPKTVLIADFQKLNGSSDVSAFVKALAEAVAIELSRVHETIVMDGGRQSGRTTADFVLNGSLLASGDCPASALMRQIG